MPFLALELSQFLTFDMDQLGKHRGQNWKKRLNISKIGNFESDTCSASEDLVPQAVKFFRSFYGGGGGVRFVTPPPQHTHTHTHTHPTIPTSVKLRSFKEPYLRYFSTNHFQTWKSC